MDQLELARRIEEVERAQRDFREEMAVMRNEVETLAAAQFVTADRVKDLHELFLRKSKTGRPPMAEQMQELLTVYHSARWAWRATMYLAAGATTIFAAWTAFQSFLAGPR